MNDGINNPFYVDSKPVDLVPTKEANEKQDWPAMMQPQWWFSTDVRPIGVTPNPEGCLSKH